MPWSRSSPIIYPSPSSGSRPLDPIFDAVKTLERPCMGYRGTELALDYFDCPRLGPLRSIPVPCDSLSGHYGSHIRIAASFELRSSIHPSFQSYLGLELFLFYCFHSHGFHGVLPPWFDWSGFFPTLICARLSVCSYSRSCTRPSLPSGSRARFFASGSASCGTWTVCAGVCWSRCRAADPEGSKVR